MQFPRFPDDMYNPYLYAGLIEDIADREREFSTYYPKLVDAQSAKLGRLCLELADGNQATESLPDYTNGESHLSPREARLYSSLSQLVLYAYDVRRAGVAQQELHFAAMDMLAEAQRQPGIKQRATMAEYTVLGLVTRYAHPNMLGYGALQHHECDTDTPGHYDVGIIFNNPGNIVEANHIQVKMACFGICRGEEPTARLREFQAHYRPYVQLLSACCHLQAFSGGRTKDYLAQQLLAESRGELDRAAIKQLDNTTDNFLLAMTTEQLPRGKHGGTSVGLQAEDFLSRL